MISQGSICTSHGGLAIYLNELYKHKLLPLYKKNTTWEGIFIENNILGTYTGLHAKEMRTTNPS